MIVIIAGTTIPKLGFNKRLFFRIAFVNGVLIHSLRRQHRELVVVAKGTARCCFVAAAAAHNRFFLLRSDLQVALGADVSVAAFGNVDFGIVQKANGTFLITRRFAVFRSREASRQLSVANELADGAFFPLAGIIEAVVVMIV